MRARVLPLGVTGLASLALVGLMPTTAMAADTDFSVQQTASNLSPYIGETVTFTVRVDNTGAAPDDSFTLTNNLPASFAYVDLVSNGGALSCDEPDPGFAGSIVCTFPNTATTPLDVVFRASARTAGAAVNAAGVAPGGGDTDGTATDNTSNLNLTVPGPAPQTAPEWHDDEDPGYPYGWNRFGPYGYGGGYGGYGGYGDFDDYDYDCDYYCY